jgi:hypothetical protein
MREQISLSEASNLESNLVLRKLETRMMIAVERAQRDAIRNGRDALEAVACDEQVAAIFGEAITEASRAGLGWMALDRAFSPKSGSADEAVREHCERTREAAKHWLGSIVVRLVPGLRLRGKPAAK